MRATEGWGDREFEPSCVLIAHEGFGKCSDSFTLAAVEYEYLLETGDNCVP